MSDLPDVLYYIVSGSVEVMIEDEEGNEDGARLPQQRSVLR